MGESQDEEDADGDNEFHRPDSDTAGKDTSQPSVSEPVDIDIEDFHSSLTRLFSMQ